jgi:hypothetical protein
MLDVAVIDELPVVLSSIRIRLSGTLNDVADILAVAVIEEVRVALSSSR